MNFFHFYIYYSSSVPQVLGVILLSFDMHCKIFSLRSNPNQTIRVKNTNNIKKLQSIHILFIFLAYSSSSLLCFHYTSPCFIAVLVQYCSPSLISQEFQVLSYSINSPLSWSSSRSFPVRLPYCNLT